MAKARSTDLIFSVDFSELQDYYGESVGPSTIKLLQKCHIKMQSCKSVLHVTTNTTVIASSKMLLMSAGGLGGCVYGVPINDDGVVHNLGKYIIDDELPMFLQNQSRAAEIGCIQIAPESTRFGCVDYLEFGSHYYAYYMSSDYLQAQISAHDLLQLHDQQSSMVNKLHALLFSNEDIDRKIKVVADSSAASYIVRVLYFEVVLEYIFLYQDNQNAREWAGRAELYNKAAKDLVFDLNPKLATKFSLKNFHASPSSIDSYLQLGDVISNYRPGQIYEYLCKRLTYYIGRYLLNATENFKGHLLFRHFGERELFEVDLAQRLWSESVRKGISIVTYRLPKGEVGVLSTAVKTSKALVLNGTYVSGEDLDIVLATQLATAHTAMRDPYTKKVRSTQ